MLKLGTIDEFKSVVEQGAGFAKSNLYYVKLPTVAGVSPYNLGLLCENIQLPTRQLTSVERRIGIDLQKPVYGYVNPAITATFRVLNDQKVRTYFENWMEFILPNYDDSKEGRWSAKYPDQYQQPIHIYQLKKGQSYPLFSKQFDKKLGPLNINIDLDLDIETKAVATYHWILERAYPSSIVLGELSDAQGAISTVQVEFEYKYWTGRPVAGGKEDASITSDFKIKF